MFWASAIPGSLAIVLVLAGVREAGRPGPRPGAGEKRRLVPFRELGVPFTVFTAVSAVFALGNSSDALLILRAQNVGTVAALVPLMYFVFNVVAATLATPLGHLSDRVGRRRLIVFGFAGYALVYAGFALAGHPASVWVLFALYGVPYAATEGMTRAYVVDLVPAPLRATALGGYTFAIGMAALPASLVAGLLWDRFTPAVPFVFSAALMFVAAVALAVAPPLRTGSANVGQESRS